MSDRFVPGVVRAVKPTRSKFFMNGKACARATGLSGLQTSTVMTKSTIFSEPGMMSSMHFPSPPSKRSLVIYERRDGVVFKVAARASACARDLRMMQLYKAGVATRIHCLQTNTREDVEYSDGKDNGEMLFMQKKSESGTRRSDRMSLTSSSGSMTRSAE